MTYPNDNELTGMTKPEEEVDWSLVVAQEQDDD